MLKIIRLLNKLNIYLLLSYERRHMTMDVVGAIEYAYNVNDALRGVK